jgi:hypothetical protein
MHSPLPSPPLLLLLFLLLLLLLFLMMMMMLLLQAQVQRMAQKQQNQVHWIERYWNCGPLPVHAVDSDAAAAAAVAFAAAGGVTPTLAACSPSLAFHVAAAPASSLQTWPFELQVPELASHYLQPDNQLPPLLPQLWM